MKEILSKGAMYKNKKAGGTGNRGDTTKKLLLSLPLLFTLHKLFGLPVDTFCMSDMILPISARFEAKPHEFVCVHECVTAFSILRLLGEMFNMNYESNDEENRPVAWEEP